jgi:RNA polymerase sigma-70 factor, ECF subfamily
MAKLRSLLAADVSLYADGGGKRPAANRPIVGLDEVVRFHESLAHLFAKNPSRIARYAFINGLPGFVTIERTAPRRPRSRSRAARSSPSM